MLTLSPDFTIPVTDAYNCVEDFTAVFASTQESSLSAVRTLLRLALASKAPIALCQDPLDTIGSQLHPGP